MSSAITGDIIYYIISLPVKTIGMTAQPLTAKVLPSTPISVTSGKTPLKLWNDLRRLCIKIKGPRGYQCVHVDRLKPYLGENTESNPGAPPTKWLPQLPPNAPPPDTPAGMELLDDSIRSTQPTSLTLALSCVCCCINLATKSVAYL